MEATKRCCTCGEQMPLSAFNVRKAAADGLQSRCRECSRAWYVQNRERQMASVRKRNVATRALYLARLGEYLLTHPCVDCGESDIRCLEFDHRDRTTKVREVTKMAQELRAWWQIELEIEKCDVRCANCHRRKTAVDFTSWRQRLFLERQDDCSAVDLHLTPLLEELDPGA